MNIGTKIWIRARVPGTLARMFSDPSAPTGAAGPEMLALELAEPTGTSGPPRRRPVAQPRSSPPQTSEPVPDPFGGGPDAAHSPGSQGEHLLQCAYGTQGRAKRFYDEQVLDRLNETMREFVGRMEMAFVATADRNGECDSSLRAGPAGFLVVLDERRLAYPEYRGNGVMASLGNISENPHVGILMVDFVRDLIGLHVNGRASVAEDADLRQRHPELPAEFERGRTPERWVVVEVEEAYVHCRKHIPRMEPVSRTRNWGTDDVKRKGGDYFEAKGAPRPWHAAEVGARTH